MTWRPRDRARKRLDEILQRLNGQYDEDELNVLVKALEMLADQIDADHAEMMSSTDPRLFGSSSR